MVFSPWESGPEGNKVTLTGKVHQRELFSCSNINFSKIRHGHIFRNVYEKVEIEDSNYW